MARPKNYPADTKVLDLDAVLPPAIVVKLDGKTHELKQISVRDFVENTRVMQEMDEKKREEDMTLESEMGSLITMLNKTFPTISEEEFWSLSLPRLYQILEFAKAHNGEQAGQTKENPPKAEA